RSTEQLVQAAIAGMTDALDEQSAYFDPETYARLKQHTEGTGSGIGVTVQPSDGGLLITEMVQGGPADLAGVVEGDLLLAIDDQAILGWPLEKVAKRIQGPRGSEVLLSVQRKGDTVRIPVIRDQVHTSAVQGRLVQAGLGYIRLDHFQRRSGQELLDEKARLESLSGGQLQGLVIDLRSNPGGLLEEAVIVSNHFLDAGTIVQTQGRLGQATNEVHTATAENTDTETRVIILINSMSASASEIVAGSLQEAGRAQLVGQVSYGKGSVQSYYEYPDNSALKLTIARYLLGSGRHLERGRGIEPDHLVALESAVAPHQALLDALSDTEMDDAKRAELVALAQALPTPKRAPLSPSFEGPVSERAENDAQLALALDLATP
ncbi:MAG: carboxyl-terminal processing protease, partial [Cognaticolwellia sp.]